MKNIPYNINSVISKAYYYLSGDDRSTKPSEEEIRGYVKSIRPIDTHFMFSFNHKLRFDSVDFWVDTLTKCMRLNLLYLTRVLRHYNSSLSNKGDLFNYVSEGVLKADIVRVLGNSFVNATVDEVKRYVMSREDLPLYVDVNRAYDYFYILDELFSSAYSFYNIVETDRYASKVMSGDDELVSEEFPLRIYGGREISRYDAIVNKANSTLYVPEPVYMAITDLWETMGSKDCRKFLRDTMSECFDKEMITAFLNQFYKTHNAQKVSFHGNIISYYKYVLTKKENTILYNSIILPPQDTFSSIVKENKEKIQKFVQEFIEKYYSCHKIVLDTRHINPERKKDKPVPVTREEEIEFAKRGENIYMPEEKSYTRLTTPKKYLFTVI